MLSIIKAKWRKKKVIKINKIVKKPSMLLFPVPTVLVTAQSEDEKPNIITVSATGFINNAPPMVYISIMPARYSHGLIKKSGEYVINIPSVDMVRVVDYCGTKSGRDVNKFQQTKLTAIDANFVKAPLIKECPVNIECKVKKLINLGSHDAFIAEIVAINYNQEVLDSKGKPDIDKIRPYAFCSGEYRVIGEKIGSFGFSARD